MTPALRTASTLTILALVCVLGAAFGLHALTKPFPKRAEAAICVSTQILSGGELFRGQVTVSVLNGSDREGLASRTLGDLVSAGFSEGLTGNAPANFVVDNATIIASDPDNPAVQLVLAHLPTGTQVVQQDPASLAVTEPGVIVVVGKNFTQLADGPDSVVSTLTTHYCSPPVN